MGRMILIMVIGLALITSFFTLKLNSNTKQGLQTTVEMFKRTQARLIANSGVEIFLEKMRRDKSLNSGTYNNNTYIDGTYDISITGPDTLLTVRSMAHFMNMQHQAIVKASRSPVPFPNIVGALYVSTAAMQNVQMTGNFTVSGFDHDMSGNMINNLPPNIVPGIAVDNPADSVAIRDVLKKNTANNITGLGGTPSIHVNTQFYNWQEISNEIAFSADQTLGSGTYNGGTLGTVASPQITLVNGNATFNGNISGAGIMVVNGDLTIRGTFDFRGIVIAYKESAITTELNGNGRVLGSLIVSGNMVNMNISNGTFNALYCKQALDNARLNLKSSRFKILSWWE